MSRKTGYLASLINVPPLVFRFQYNPVILAEKKAFKYTPSTAFGRWDLPGTAAATGPVSLVTGLYGDVKGIGPLLVQTKPLEADEGEPRSIGLEFQLDADNPGPLDGDDHYGGSIEPDLALLRSFMNPSFDVVDVGTAIAALAGSGSVPCWKRPPEVSLYYGGLSLTCVMTALDVKMVAFHDDGKPARAEVTVTLKEQTDSVSPVVDWFVRQYQVGRSFGRRGFWSDVANATPIVNAFT